MVMPLTWEATTRCNRCHATRAHPIDALPFRKGGLLPLNTVCTKCGNTCHTVISMGPRSA